jgi:hypothetical protein
VAATPDHGLTFCPNPSGLELFSAKARTGAIQAAEAYDRASLALDLHNTDRVWWPNVRKMWASGTAGNGFTLNGTDMQFVLGSAPVETNGYAVFMGPACGASTLAKSIMVGIGPSPSSGNVCNACRTSLFFVDRRGRPLLSYIY